MTPSALQLKVLASLLLVAAGSASADVYSNVPTGANTGSPFAYFGNNPSTASGDSAKVGEVFSLTSNSTLSSFSFYALGNQSASLQLNVAQWNSGTNAKNQAVNTVGAALLTTTVSALETYNAAGGFTTLQFDNLGLNLTAGTKYIAYLTSNDSSVTGLQLSRTQTTLDTTGFGIGNAYLSNIPDTGWVLPFSGSGFLSLQYTAVTAAAPVPEPESLALLLAGLGVVGAVVIKRRTTVKQA